MSKSIKLCKRLKKPSEAHKTELARLFPSSTSSPSPRPELNFDPRARSVVEKKKASITRDRPRKVTVVMLPELSWRVPKSAARKKLNKDGRIKKLEFRRNMTFLQAKNVIIKAFSNFQLTELLYLLTELLYLSCEQSSVMKKAATQMPNGDDLIGIAGQGSLYVCEVNNISVVSLYSCQN